MHGVDHWRSCAEGDHGAGKRSYRSIPFLGVVHHLVTATHVWKAMLDFGNPYFEKELDIDNSLDASSNDEDEYSIDNDGGNCGGSHSESADLDDLLL
jgi:hypothetical protein